MGPTKVDMEDPCPFFTLTVAHMNHSQSLCKGIAYGSHRFIIGPQNHHGGSRYLTFEVFWALKTITMPFTVFGIRSRQILLGDPLPKGPEMQMLQLIYPTEDREVFSLSYLIKYPKSPVSCLAGSSISQGQPLGPSWHFKAF